MTGSLMLDAFLIGAGCVIVGKYTPRILSIVLRPMWWIMPHALHVMVYHLIEWRIARQAKHETAHFIRARPR